MAARVAVLVVAALAVVLSSGGNVGAAGGGGHGRRTPFLTSYALTRAFITFVSLLYFKDFTSTLHQPFLHHPPPRHRPMPSPHPYERSHLLKRGSRSRRPLILR